MRFKYFCSFICLIVCIICSCKKNDQVVVPINRQIIIDTIPVPTKITFYNRIIPNSIYTIDNEYDIIGGNSMITTFDISRPKLLAYTPKKEVKSGTSVIICPGGAYVYESFTLEGSLVAQQFAQNGITAFVLEYRIPSDSTMLRKEIGPLQDAQRAIQIVRENAKRWGLNPNKIGIVGFSAGGHLASTLATHSKKTYISNPYYTSLRPNFQCLIYPLISMTDSLGHMLSRSQLLGANPSKSAIYEYSNEFQVTKDTPPCFLVHSKDDATVSVKNSIYFDKALKSYNIPEQLYLYDSGGHGFGLNNPSSTVKWFDLMMIWLQNQGFVYN